MEEFMHRLTKMLFCLFLCGFIVQASQLFAEEVEVRAIPVADKIYMLTGKGGNIGLLLGDDGTFLIDDQFAPLTEKILAAIKSAGGDTPKFLINTHYHGDHTGGNENLGKKGVLIFSHENVRERLLSGSYLKPFDMSQPGAAKEALPVVTFSRDISFHLNGDTVQVLYAPHSHTDGDSFVYFKKANVLHTGDLFFNGFYPFIDVDHGGTLKGMIDGVDKVLGMIDDSTKIIPGHGPLADIGQLKEYRNMLAIVYARLNKMKIEGKSAEEAAAAKPLEDLEADWGDGMFTGERWIQLIYSGV